jgi:hypothetical protein
MMRGDLRPPESLRNLVAWCRAKRIDAIGVGSPWTPANEETYVRYEGVDRDLYYSGTLDQPGLRQVEEVEGLLRDLNSLSGGTTLFYLDNETPKGRYGHLWWIGWQYDFPAWHDYDQPFDRWMLEEAPPGSFDPEPMPYERRPYLEIVAAQRRAGALGIWAHPTSWWWTRKGAFVTNIASELPFHLFAQGGIDGMVIMGYRAWQMPYLDLWWRILDMGYRVPGLAEVDKGLSGENDSPEPFLTWYRTGNHSREGDAGGGTDLAEIRREAAAGRVVASNGPFIDVTLDGQPMGCRVLTTGGRTHQLSIRAAMPDGIPGRILVFTRGGRLAWDHRDFPGGSLELGLDGGDAPAWYVCCLIDGGGALRGEPAPRFAAIANPVWLVTESDRVPSAMQTQVEIRFGAGSSWIGGKLDLQTAAGETLESFAIRPGSLRRSVPADGRLSLEAASGLRDNHYLLSCNPRAQELQRYLYRGKFLVDHPAARRGEVPVEAFRLDECRSALEHLVVQL